MTATRRLLLPVTLLLLAAPACVLGPDIVGETLTQGMLSPGTGTDTATTDAGGAPSTTQVDPTEGGPIGYGQPCELGPPEAMEETAAPPDDDDPQLVQASVLSSINDCASAMCLLVYDDILPATCDVDADCGTPDAACWEGQCHLRAPYVLDHARCTQACDSVADCPDIDGCQAGVSCVVISTLGTHCCQPVCACNDELDLPAAEIRTQQCAMGFPACP